MSKADAVFNILLKQNTSNLLIKFHKSILIYFLCLYNAIIIIELSIAKNLSFLNYQIRLPTKRVWCLTNVI